MATSSYVEIDVSNDRLDLAVLGEERVWHVDNTRAGLSQLVRQMQALQPELIVVEALFWAGLAMAVVNPARVRQFAQACGLLAKTDKLDTQILAVFGQRVQPRRYEGKSEAGKQLSGLLVCAGSSRRCSRQSKTACEPSQRACEALWGGSWLA